MQINQNVVVKIEREWHQDFKISSCKCFVGLEFWNGKRLNFEI